MTLKFLKIAVLVSMTTSFILPAISSACVVYDTKSNVLGRVHSNYAVNAKGKLAGRFTDTLIMKTSGAIAGRSVGKVVLNSRGKIVGHISNPLILNTGYQAIGSGMNCKDNQLAVAHLLLLQE